MKSEYDMKQKISYVKLIKSKVLDVNPLSHTMQLNNFFTLKCFFLKNSNLEKEKEEDRLSLKFHNI